ncbi:putative 2-aminoethylphosphonate ABC transporter substrate-binding protein [Bacillus piscicola]|uniref:putative 2-aminoethylphosphonate ABC transporter substrate-binding protein n=1 Tax=Bacillus piscicola TaxID=1632684 RepID=UPI001F08CBC2|nr:putative 2-aminoethylphosphonate ABC transporter substrate-binding protein [Bacillus piscicola]
MKKLIGFISILCLLFLFGCGGSGENKDTKAASEKTGGSLVVYTPMETDHLQDYLSLFEKDHPEIKVETVRDSSGVITSRLLAEKNNPQADIIIGMGVENLILLDEEGMIEGYTPKHADKIVDMFADQKNDPMKWVGSTGYMTTISVNTVELEKKGLPIPKSYEDLLNPEYEGLISMPNPASSGVGFVMVSLMLQMFDDEEKGWEYLDNLHDNIGAYTHSGSKPAVEAAKGEFPIGISFDGRSIQQEDSGAPLVTIFPEEGSGWTLEANSLVKKDNIKEEARVFLDWAISEETMRVNRNYYALTGVDVDEPLHESYPKDPKEQLSDNDFYWSAENRERIIDRWIKSYDSKSEAKEE